MYKKFTQFCIGSDDSELIFNLSFKRYEFSFILIIWEWCNNLSSMAFANVTSLNISCYLPNGLLVVIIVECFSS